MQCPFVSRFCNLQFLKSCSVTYKLNKVTNKVKVCQKSLKQVINHHLVLSTMLFQICTSPSSPSSQPVGEVCIILHPTVCKTVENQGLLGQVRTEYKYRQINVTCIQVLAETSCVRLSERVCTPANCEMIEGKEECSLKFVKQWKYFPSESCQLVPREVCTNLTSQWAMLLCNRI